MAGLQTREIGRSGTSMIKFRRQNLLSSALIAVKPIPVEREAEEENDNDGPRENS
jgi:hypothetical protein